MGDRLYVVVSGPPGSGKSTLAPALAGGLGLPLLAKDTIKEALLATWPALDVDGSRRTGLAAMDVVFALASASPCGAVLEGNFHRSLAEGSIGALPGRTVEVFCRCRREVALQRYRERAASRHAGHLDATRTDAPDLVRRGERTGGRWLARTGDRHERPGGRGGCAGARRRYSGEAAGLMRLGARLSAA